MADYSFTGAKWGASTIGTSGGVVTWSFAQLPGAFYSFDAAISQATYQSLVRDAFQAWENIANIDFVEVADTTSAKIRLGWDAIDGQRGTIGEASYTISNGSSFAQLLKSEIRFDTAEAWTTAKHYVAGTVNFFAVAAHEIGHALGLAHTDERDTIMFPSIGTRVTLSSGDIAGAQALYGAKSAPTVPASASFYGTSGNDTFFGTAANDFIYGNAGNDRLMGGAGNDRVDGGAGIDVAVFGGGKNQFGLRLSGDGTTVVDLRVGSPEGTDTLAGIERLSFADGTLAYDLAGNAGQAYRLYEAAFNRAPDAAGLGFWINSLDTGTHGLWSAASGFMASAEFTSLYGASSSLSNSGFIDLLYQNVLDRSPDASGYQFWTSQMTAGWTRERVLVGFSESSENQSSVAAAIENGIWFT